MALKFWINESGKICLRDGKVLLCETSPCGVTTTCCEVSLPATLFFSWTAEFGGLPPGPTGSGGTIPIVWDAGSVLWTWTGEPADFGATQCVGGQIATIQLVCTGLGTADLVVTDVLGGMEVTPVVITSCSPFLIEVDDSETITFGCNSHDLIGVTITE